MLGIWDMRCMGYGVFPSQPTTCAQLIRIRSRRHFIVLVVDIDVGTAVSGIISV